MESTEEVNQDSGDKVLEENKAIVSIRFLFIRLRFKNRYKIISVYV